MSASGSLSVIDVGGESWQRRLDGITAARLELAAAEGQAGDGEQAARQLMAAQWLVDDGVICALATLILGSQTLKLQLNAGFERTIPASHPYIANYMQHHTELKGLGNAVRILTNLILLPILLSCTGVSPKAAVLSLARKLPARPGRRSIRSVASSICFPQGAFDRIGHGFTLVS